MNRNSCSRAMYTTKIKNTDGRDIRASLKYEEREYEGFEK